MAFLSRASAAWARLELFIAAALAAAITVLILVNIVTRSAGQAIFWIDEAAIYAMIWMAFLAASAALAHRTSIAVSLIPDLTSRRVGHMIRLFVDLVTLVFAILIVWLSWRWFDPLGVVRAGFDLGAFQGSTFNFIYAEPTVTLGFKKAWVWAVIPLFSIGALLHTTANLVETLRHSDAGAEDMESVEL